MTREAGDEPLRDAPAATRHLVIILFGITLVTFFLLRLIPGDPALAILGSSYTHTRAVAIDNTLGLNKPIWSQYGLFMGRLFHGNLGFSFFYNEPATTVIAQHIWPTVFLIVYSAVLAALISLPIGFRSGLRRGGVPRPVLPRLLHAQLRDARVLARHHPDPDLQREPARVPAQRLRPRLRRPPVLPVPARADHRAGLLHGPGAQPARRHHHHAAGRVHRHRPDEGHPLVAGALEARVPQRGPRRGRRLRRQPGLPDQRDRAGGERVLAARPGHPAGQTPSRTATTRSCRG